MSDDQYHIELSDGDVDGPVLLPGDPDRIDIIADCWDNAEPLADHREYRTAAGEYDGEPLAATSTGIGSPSAAIAVEELARVGAETFIRVGSCGTIQPEVEVGDLVITTAAVRKEGTSDEYIRADYPASAHDEVVTALVTAAERLGHEYHLGVTCSTDSFYAGQARDGVGGFRAAGAEAELEALREAGVLNFEMEASTVLTLAGLYGLRAGAVCTVYADRTTGEFRTDGQQKAAETASLAAALLSKMDRLKNAAGVDRWHAGLSLDDH
ncbi:uridine phosphorylase [Natronomonas pharaonis DSM 2160]|uniref:Uridine phosphorylase n=1 Tax=Natronomonas pharaonis (strain ATCC 35678 / DSM 2160 / CIP 103997 / JCM 8858 / NBRC 14720 / NCIMB 2260 / Gabara) TaxID=348780 RepID=A0A1U7EXF8_NATPD|nr:nucleoside phosphorylase [Natronomonas pharaonis]CAI49846.1 uridine phosphorylase [Natronomonas pharaonis DSM 2160]